MTYSGFQKFDECQAYHKMKREQEEDDARQAKFYREVEKQNELEIKRQIEDDMEDLVNEENK